MSQDTFATTMPVCYEILLYLSSRMAKLNAGDVLEFVTSDPDTSETIPAWCDLRGFSLLESTLTEDGRQRFLIQK